MKGGLSPEYLSYIHSKEWRVICKRIHARDKMCQGCGVKKHLDVHHKTYDNFRNESDDELVLVCRSCHDAIHAQKGAYGKNLWKVTERVLVQRRLGLIKVVKILPQKVKDQKERRRKAKIERKRKRKWDKLRFPKKYNDNNWKPTEYLKPVKPIGLVAQALAKYKKK